MTRAQLAHALAEADQAAARDGPALFAAPTTSAYQARVVADGASAYWPLDDPIGSATVRDLIGTRHATVTGPVTLAQPGIGRSRAVQMTTAAQLLLATFPSLGTACTLEAWGYATDLPADQMHVLTGEIFSNGDFQFSCRRIPTATFRLTYFGGDLSQQFEMLVPQASVVGTWAHIVITAAAGVVQWYFNGVPSGPTAPIVMSGAGAAPQRAIGSHPTPGLGWIGFLQDVAIYPRALTPAEITAHYALRFTTVRLLPENRQGPGVVGQIPTDDFTFSIVVNQVAYVHVSTDAAGVWEYAPLNS
jgi:hypothetical protein